jgi:hypothetical protein
MIHPIVKYGDPVLETPTKRIDKFDDEIQKLVADMFESMYAASGVGLAAPQIGIGLRVAVIDVSNGKIEAKLVCANGNHSRGVSSVKRAISPLQDFAATWRAAVRHRAHRMRQALNSMRGGLRTARFCHEMTI